MSSGVRILVDADVLRDAIVAIDKAIDEAEHAHKMAMIGLRSARLDLVKQIDALGDITPIAPIDPYRS